MQAILLSQGGSMPECKNIPVPRPGAGEVLVKMHAAPINPSDLAFLKGGYGIQRPLPTVPGFEGSGTVVAAGSGILPRLWLGKKVACAAVPQHNGTWAEYMVTGASSCVPLSKIISPDQGAMMFVNPLTALAFFDVLKETSNPGKKPRAIINTAGASSLGKMVTRLGQRKGIEVISVVRRQEQVEMLQAAGAKYVVNSSAPDFEDHLKKLAHQLNARVAFDAVCGPLSQQLLSCMPKGSKLFIYGRLSDQACEIDAGQIIFTGNQVQGFWLTNWLHQKNMWQTYLNTRKVQALMGNELESTIQQQFPPQQIALALESYKNNMSKGKVLIKF